MGALALLYDSTTSSISYKFVDSFVETTGGLTMSLEKQPPVERSKFDRGEFLASLKPAVDQLKDEDEEAWRSLREEDAVFEGANADGLDD
jgi:hypothetical protein